MKEKIVTIVFCLVICVISGSTLIRKIVDTNDGRTSQEEIETLSEQNTIAENHEIEKRLMEENREKNEDFSKEDAGKEENKSFLDTIGNAVDSFTEDLSGKEQGAEINSKISSVTSGDTYIESKTVLLGKENWLFYKASDDGDSISDYKGTNHYKNEKMRSIKDKLEEEALLLKKKGSKLVLLMVPNKESVYAEKMPDNVKRKSENTRMDLFADYLKKHSKLQVVYPKKELIAAKSAYPTYYKTDTHWNQIGVFIGVQALKENLDGNFEALSDVEFVEKKKEYAGDLAKLCKMTDVYHDDIKYELNTGSIDKSLKSDKRLLIVGDSFSDLMPTIAKKYFSEIKTVGIWSFSMKEVEKYQPDVVVWECVERYLDRYDWIKLNK